VQGEGGVNVARPQWLRALAERCRRHILLILDVQMGCGRTGPFFSSEVAGIPPDLVCLSNSIGGYGLPLAPTLIRPDLDVWEPGEHSGTSRGVDPALVSGAAALCEHWSDDALERSSVEKGGRVADALSELAGSVSGTEVRPAGAAWPTGLRSSSARSRERGQCGGVGTGPPGRNRRAQARWSSSSRR
jgi:diaminobutyrate-2-oxoglutarate transaminase